jgi:hypothetical protein
VKLDLVISSINTMNARRPNASNGQAGPESVTAGVSGENITLADVVYHDIRLG